MSEPRMTLEEMKRQIARKAVPLDATTLRLKQHDPQWYAAALASLRPATGGTGEKRYNAAMTAPHVVHFKTFFFITSSQPSKPLTKHEINTQAPPVASIAPARGAAMAAALNLSFRNLDLRLLCISEGHYLPSDLRAGR